jgi:hypothetical protein
MKTIRNILIVLGVLGALSAMYLLFHKDFLIGISSLVSSLCLIYFGFKNVQKA